MIREQLLLEADSERETGTHIPHRVIYINSEEENGGKRENCKCKHLEDCFVQVSSCALLSNGIRVLFRGLCLKRRDANIKSDRWAVYDFSSLKY